MKGETSGWPKDEVTVTEHPQNLKGQGNTYIKLSCCTHYNEYEDRKGYEKRHGASTPCQAPILSRSQLAWHSSNWCEDRHLPKVHSFESNLAASGKQRNLRADQLQFYPTCTTNFHHTLTCGSKSRDTKDIHTVKTPVPLLFSSQVRSWECVQRCKDYKQKHIFTWAYFDMDVYNVFWKALFVLTKLTSITHIHRFQLFYEADFKTFFGAGGQAVWLVGS